MRFARTARATLSSVWIGANWCERELTNVRLVFDDHPDLSRIFLEESFPVTRAEVFLPPRSARAEAENAVPVGPFGIDPSSGSLACDRSPARRRFVFNGALAQIYLSQDPGDHPDRLGPCTRAVGFLRPSRRDQALGKEDIRALLTDKGFPRRAVDRLQPDVASYVVIPFAPGIVGADLSVGFSISRRSGP